MSKHSMMWEKLIKMARWIRAELVEPWKRPSVDTADDYLPQRSFMRGPGPKWHAKHDGTRPDRQ